MKSNLTTREHIQTEQKYPVLKMNINSNGEEVVLFTDKTKGTVIYSTKKMHPVGYHSEGWVPIQDKGWKDYDGIVQLYN